VSRMDAKEKRRIVEALILSSAEPISAARIAEIIPYCDAGQAKDYGIIDRIIDKHA